MTEAEPIADFGELAWATHVIHNGEKYDLCFWSPHKLHQMERERWYRFGKIIVVTMPAPHHKFFRDGMVLQVAEDQWLLYTTARGKYYSQIEIYQSFDLEQWQYIRTALSSGFGSERNSPFSSMKSPFVVDYQGHYYLSLTYNNECLPAGSFAAVENLDEPGSLEPKRWSFIRTIRMTSACIAGKIIRPHF